MLVGMLGSLDEREGFWWIVISGKLEGSGEGILGKERVWLTVEFEVGGELVGVKGLSGEVRDRIR